MKPEERKPGARIVRRPDGSRAIECNLDFDGPVIYDDGEVNWAAAFAADDGAGTCEVCAHLRGGNPQWLAWHPCWHDMQPTWKKKE